MQWSLKYGFSVETGQSESSTPPEVTRLKRQVQLYGVRYDLSVVQVRLYVRTLSNIRVARVIGSNYGLVHCGALTKPSSSTAWATAHAPPPAWGGDRRPSRDTRIRSVCVAHISHDEHDVIGARQCVNLLYERTATGPAAHIRHTDAMRDVSDLTCCMLGRVECVSVTLCPPVPVASWSRASFMLRCRESPRVPHTHSHIIVWVGLAGRAINHLTEYEVLCP